MTRQLICPFSPCFLSLSSAWLCRHPLEPQGARCSQHYVGSWHISPDITQWEQQILHLLSITPACSKVIINYEGSKFLRKKNWRHLTLSLMLRFPKRTFPCFVIVVFESSPETTETGHRRQTSRIGESSFPLSAAEIFPFSRHCYFLENQNASWSWGQLCCIFFATIQKGL